MKFNASNILIFLLTCLCSPLSTVTFAEGKNACPLKDSTTKYSWGGTSDGLQDAYKALQSCPQITDLNLHFVHGGCVPSFEPWAFNFRNGDIFPTLRNLTIYDYDFEYSDLEAFNNNALSFRPSSLAKSWDQMRLGLSSWLGLEDSPNLDKWLQAMNWTGIERLDVTARRQSGQDYFWKRMKHELPNLKHLTTQVGTFSEPMLEFMESIPALETLSILNPWPIKSSNSTSQFSCAPFHLDRLLHRHGATLQDLRLTQYESSTANQRRVACNAADIRQLYTLCSSLTHLTLDLDRNGTWPEAELKELVSLDSLTSLHLRLELGNNLHIGDKDSEYGWNPEGITSGGPFREPMMNTTVADDLFHRLRHLKNGQDLIRLEIEVGDFDIPPWTGPMYIPMWGEGRARKFVCEAPYLHDKDVKPETKDDELRGLRVPACQILGDKDPYDDDYYY